MPANGRSSPSTSPTIGGPFAGRRQSAGGFARHELGSRGSALAASPTRAPGPSPSPGSRGAMLQGNGPAGVMYGQQHFNPKSMAGARTLAHQQPVRVVTHSPEARPSFGVNAEAAGGAGKGRRDSMPSRDGYGRDSVYDASPHSPYRGSPGSLPGSRQNSRVGRASSAATSRTPAVSHGFAADQNERWRNYMEDEHCIAKLDELREGAMWFGLFDGHGGRTACELAASQLHKTFIDEALSGGIATRQQVCEALRRAFLKVDRMLLPAGAIHCGSTAAVAVYLPKEGGNGAELYVANTGDTRVVLIAGATPGAPQRLSTDHLPSNNAETQRVIGCGGAIINGRVGGSLAVTRALGDHSLKAGPPACGVSAEPSVVARDIGPTDRYLIMASDGIWDVVSEAAAQAHILTTAGGSNLQVVAGSLVKKAVEEGSRDNVSVLLVRFA